MTWLPWVLLLLVCLYCYRESRKGPLGWLRVQLLESCWSWSSSMRWWSRSVDDTTRLVKSWDSFVQSLGGLWHTLAFLDDTLEDTPSRRRHVKDQLDGEKRKQTEAEVKLKQIQFESLRSVGAVLLKAVDRWLSPPMPKPCPHCQHDNIKCNKAPSVLACGTGTGSAGHAGSVGSQGTYNATMCKKSSVVACDQKLSTDADTDAATWIKKHSAEVCSLVDSLGNLQAAATGGGCKIQILGCKRNGKQLSVRIQLPKDGATASSRDIIDSVWKDIQKATPGLDQVKIEIVNDNAATAAENAALDDVVKKLVAAGAAQDAPMVDSKLSEDGDDL